PRAGKILNGRFQVPYRKGDHREARLVVWWKRPEARANRQHTAVQVEVDAVARMLRQGFQPDRVPVEMYGSGYVFRPQADNRQLCVQINFFIYLTKTRQCGKSKTTIKLSANTWVRGAPKCLRQYIT
ncbi:MAG: hypothetical protein ACXWNC_05070, partial [Anaerolineales bacterium]